MERLLLGCCWPLLPGTTKPACEACTCSHASSRAPRRLLPCRDPGQHGGAGAHVWPEQRGWPCARAAAEGGGSGGQAAVNGTGAPPRQLRPAADAANPLPRPPVQPTPCVNATLSISSSREDSHGVFRCHLKMSSRLASLPGLARFCAVLHCALLAVSPAAPLLVPFFLQLLFRRSLRLPSRPASDQCTTLRHRAPAPRATPPPFPIRPYAGCSHSPSQAASRTVRSNPKRSAAACPGRRAVRNCTFLIAECLCQSSVATIDPCNLPILPGALLPGRIAWASPCSPIPARTPQSVL